MGTEGIICDAFRGVFGIVSQPSLMSTLLAAAVIVVGVAACERAALSPVKIAVVASLAALASAGRVAFASIPNVQPTTFIVAVSGMVLGPAQGFMIGVLSAVASNVFLGHGPWTIWQMAAWGAVGASAGVFGSLFPTVNGRTVAAFTGVWGFLYGLIMNVWHWLAFTFPLNMRTLLIVEAAGLSFDAMHAVGNVIFSLAFGDGMLKMLRRFSRRLTHLVAAFVVICMGFFYLNGLWTGLCAAAPATETERAIARGIEYLRSSQNADGGFPAFKGGGSSGMVTAWVVLALRAAGVNPESEEWRRGGTTPGEFLLSADEVAEVDSAPDSVPSTVLARHILALRAVGTAPCRERAARLARVLASRQTAEGQIAAPGEEDLFNAHFWSVVALSSDPNGLMDRNLALRFLTRNQNQDGGFGFARGLPSDPDDTAAAIQAMVALGETGQPLSRAVRYLLSTVGADGGVTWQGGRPNVASGSWALQALNAVRRSSFTGADEKRRALESWIRGLQASDGSFMYMQGSDSMAVWMTSQAVLGLSGLYFPWAVGFSDLPLYHWAEPRVRYLAGLGVVTGYSDGTFRPDNGVTRAELAAMLARLVAAQRAAGGQAGAGLPTIPSFRDVPRGHWAYGAVEEVYRLGLLKGLGGGMFGPGQPVTGAHVVTVACRLAGVAVRSPLPGEAWYEPYVSAASSAGLLYPCFVPSEPASRAACAHTLAMAARLSLR